MNNALFNSLEKHLQHKFKQSEYQTIQYFKLYRFLLKEFVIKWLFHWVVCYCRGKNCLKNKFIVISERLCHFVKSSLFEKY